MFKRKNKTRGQSVVEMALILPVVLLVIFGVIEFGRALFIYTVVSNAAREGVRAGLVAPTDLTWITQRIHARLVLVRPEDVSIEVKCDNGSDNPVDRFECTDATVEPGRTRVVVIVNTPFTMITPILQSIFPATTIHFESARTVVTGVRAHKPP